jgi:hypothetical protein
MKQGVPERRVEISGKVNTMGNRKKRPHAVPMGTDQTMALGTSTEGFRASSAMLVTSKISSETRIGRKTNTDLFQYQHMYTLCSPFISVLTEN